MFGATPRGARAFFTMFSRRTFVFVSAVVAAALSGAAVATPPQESRPYFDAPNRKPRFGVEYFPTESAAAGGILVRRVVPGAPADVAGVKSGDVLLSVMGRGFGGDDDLVELLEEHPEGGPMTCVVARDGVELKIVVEVDAAGVDNGPIVVETTERKPASRDVARKAGDAALAEAERRLAAAREILSEEAPTKERLRLAREHLDLASKLLLAARAAEATIEEERVRVERGGAPEAPAPPKPKSIAERAGELKREGKSFDEIEAILRSEFRLAVVIAPREAVEATTRPAPMKQAASAADSRPAAPPKK
jgi:hypothetical protein